MLRSVCFRWIHVTGRQGPANRNTQWSALRGKEEEEKMHRPMVHMFAHMHIHADTLARSLFLAAQNSQSAECWCFIVTVSLILFSGQVDLWQGRAPQSEEWWWLLGERVFLYCRHCSGAGLKSGVVVPFALCPRGGGRATHAQTTKKCG